MFLVAIASTFGGNISEYAGGNSNAITWGKCRVRKNRFAQLPVSALNRIESEYGFTGTPRLTASKNNALCDMMPRTVAKTNAPLLRNCIT